MVVVLLSCVHSRGRERSPAERKWQSGAGRSLPATTVHLDARLTWHNMDQTALEQGICQRHNHPIHSDRKAFDLWHFRDTVIIVSACPGTVQTWVSCNPDVPLSVHLSVTHGRESHIKETWLLPMNEPYITILTLSHCTFNFLFLVIFMLPRSSYTYI